MFFVVKINFLHNGNWNYKNIKITQKWKNKGICEKEKRLKPNISKKNVPKL